MRFTIEDYSQQFKMSKEMIHTKIREKKLNYIIENAITYIIVARSKLSSEKRQDIHEEKVAKKNREKIITDIEKPKTTVATIIALYQRENAQLKIKIQNLEQKVDSLIDDKEQMLRQERDRIESVYQDKDAQLKSILELVNTKLLLEAQHRDEPLLENDYHEAELDSKSEPEPEEEYREINNTQLVELKHYLKTLDLKSSLRKKIRHRFQDAFGHDVRVIQQNGLFYLDFTKYDYSDLLNY